MTLPAIDRYQIIRGLGRGAMGSVYLANDPKIGREVAVKVLQSEFARSEKHRARFEREARAIAALRHPNIVEIYDYGGTPEQYLFLVMEFVKGPHLGRVVREHGEFPETVLAAAGMELCAALGAAHKAGIIHRDLKPENVFLDGGRLVLADFGIAKAISEASALGAEAARPHTDVIGTPGFMAPEQLKQEPLTERTDIFALGALLYFMATKTLPYDADSPYALLKLFRDNQPTPLVQLRPEMSEQLSNLVGECIEVEPGLRPASVEVIWQRLRDILVAAGAREPRDLLAAYVADPGGYRGNERQSLEQHLVARLKISVRDQDAIGAHEVRQRLRVVAPENAEAREMTGVRTLLKSMHLDHEQSLFTQMRRRWLLWTGAFVALLIGLGAWLGLDVLPSPDGSLTGTPAAVAYVTIAATDPTSVFLNGRALGSTPDLTPVMVDVGRQSFEFVRDKVGRLDRQLDLAAGQRLELFVDWEQKKVLTPEERQSQQPAKKKKRRKR